MKFIGMDAHSRSCTFIVLGKNGRVLRRAKVKTQEDELLGFVRSVKGKKKMALEEGVMSQWLYMLFKEEVEELVVCQACERRGAKTDNIDAGEIADLLRVGRLKTVFHSDNDLMHLRTLISGYRDVIQEIVRTKNRYKALYRQVAIPARGTGFYREEKMISLLNTDESRYVAGALFEQLSLLENQRLGYVEKFETNCSKCKPVKLLTSIPGIGPVRANQIVGIVITPYRFPTKYNFFSYATLIKHSRMSDGKEYGKKRACGQTVLKEIFKMATFSALSSNTAFRRKYDAMREAGKTDHAARNAVAKKLAATTLGVWKSGKKYNDKNMEVTQRQKQNCHSGA